MILATLLVAAAAQTTVSVVDLPPSGPNAYYVGNRAPLKPGAFVKLKIGSIHPEGWVGKQLQLEADGETGHLEEISPWLKKENNAWLSPTGEGVNGWEEVPYWLKGFGDVGYILHDRRIIDHALVWINAVLASQREDGWLGPRSNLTANKGKPDMWPNMPMLFALQSFYEWSGDRRVLAAMGKYFKWQLALPDSDFFGTYWDKQRGGDNLFSVYWLYNRTGEAWLLDLAKKIHRNTADWVSGVPDWHGVNFAQAFKEPEEFSELSRDPAAAAASNKDYLTMRNLYGQVPGGMYGADENARQGFHDPRQATETCSFVEMMNSYEILLDIDGSAKWAERCEDVTFNSLPASLTPDLKALHYLTSPNMIVADAGSKAPELQNGGPMLLFDPHDHRCCQHNVSHGWPYYTEHLWLATARNGLGVALYAPSTVHARAGNGSWVTIHESTDYPFGETVHLYLETARPNRFPLTLRLPSWCSRPSLSVNGKRVNLPRRGAYAIVTRTWKKGDTVDLRLPMHISLTTWAQNGNAVSVQRGPLTYALFLGERYVRYGGTDAWPALEVYPTTNTWNYGLIPVVQQFKFEQKLFAQDIQPFTPYTVPCQILAPARRIPEWRADKLGLVGLLQQSPAKSSQPVEWVTLIPMGAERLRISEFPTVTSNPGGGAAWTTSR